jgi:hypothetical protein
MWFLGRGLTVFLEKMEGEVDRRKEMVAKGAGRTLEIQPTGK